MSSIKVRIVLLVMLATTVWQCGIEQPETPVTEPAVVTSAPDNFILIALDTLRADYLGQYGFEVPVSPFLDSLSRSGVILADVTAQVPSTVASHKAVFRSQYLHRQKLNPQDKTATTLASIFAGNGWDTGAVVDGGLMNRQFGNAVGFQEYDDSGGPLDSILERSLNWIDTHRQNKFCFFMHTYEIHSPYDPPDSYADLFTDRPNSNFENRETLDPRYLNKHTLSAEDTRFIRARYKAGIRYTDAVMAELFQALRDRDLLQNSIVVIFSDHGESLGEKTYFGHNRLYETQLRVPVIIVAPGLSPYILEGPVETVDILPTLLTMFNLPVPEVKSGLQGIDLAGFIKGRSSLTGDRYRISEKSDFAIRDIRDWKLIMRDKPENDELYRLSDDPDEHENLLEKNPETAAQLREQYQAISGVDIYNVQRRDKNKFHLFVPETFRKNQGDSQEKMIEKSRDTLSPALEDQLKELGYIK